MGQMHWKNRKRLRQLRVLGSPLLELLINATSRFSFHLDSRYFDVLHSSHAYLSGFDDIIHYQKVCLSLVPSSGEIFIQS